MLETRAGDGNAAWPQGVERMLPLRAGAGMLPRAVLVVSPWSQAVPFFAVKSVVGVRD
jgi:hypothetical protein